MKGREFTFLATFSLLSPSSDLKVPIVKLGAAGSPITSSYKCLSYRGESKVKVKNFICFVLVPARATVSSRELVGEKRKKLAKKLQQRP